MSRRFPSKNSFEIMTSTPRRSFYVIEGPEKLAFVKLKIVYENFALLSDLSAAPLVERGHLWRDVFYSSLNTPKEPWPERNASVTSQ
jgi:hypothetical protein